MDGLLTEYELDTVDELLAVVYEADVVTELEALGESVLPDVVATEETDDTVDVLTG